ncbi:MAG: hypothetical protein SYC29_16850 [Planctomycetota bacterium]|nr:hypothetical protein [Planctomycetota bacterium]
MNGRNSNLRLVIGLVLSLLLHAAVIVPWLMMAFTSHGPGSRMQAARFNPEDFRPPPPDEEQEEPPEVELGIDAETPSTLTWVGYEEYERHLARLAEYEQAAFTDEPAGAPLTPPQPPELAPEVAPEIVPDTPPLQAPVEEQPQPQPPEQPEQPAEPTAAPPGASEAPGDEALTAITDWLDGLAARTEPEPEEPAEPQGQPENVDPMAQWLERIETLTAQEPAEPGKATKGENQPPATPKTPETQPPDASKDRFPAAEAAPSDPGEHADKESDPTSTIEVPLDEIDPGRPIARPGLEVKPRKPQFTNLVLVTASPGNPLVEIRFNSDGRPVKAGILESSRDARVDHAIEASLYRWRASGKALGDLKGEQTANIRIRIILNPRATKKPEGG